MEQFRGKILDGDQVVLDNVEGVLYVGTDPKGLREWGGSFDIDNYNSIPNESKRYLLELEDGRRGKIVITRKNGLGPVEVEFDGAGPLEGNV